ncbi:MAG: hypothetical protein D6692_03680 [Planctomycetota bacterium]|nr:MAG: hypothetical protein D6692_03680 [Planctomycetota bacterium]
MIQPPRTISLLETSGLSPGRDAPGSGDGGGGRPWIGVRFVCAGAYVRVYRNVQGTGYLASCPKCGRRMRFRVGPGGTNSRFFDVSC